MRKWISRLFLTFLPADGEGDPPADPPAEPAAAAEPPAEPPAEPSEVDQLRAKVNELETGRDAAIREEAERLLLDIVPEAADPNYPQPGQYPQAAPDPGQEPEELSPEERLDRLERAHQQNSLDQQSRQLVGHLERIRSADCPNMDLGEVLNIIAARPDVNIQKLCEISHGRNTDRMEQYHQARLKNPEHRAELGLPADPGGGNPANAEPQRTPPLLPGKGPTTAGGEPITSKNAKRILAERLRARGWGT